MLKANFRQFSKWCRVSFRAYVVKQCIPHRRIQTWLTHLSSYVQCISITHYTTSVLLAQLAGSHSVFFIRSEPWRNKWHVLFYGPEDLPATRPEGNSTHRPQPRRNHPLASSFLHSPPDSWGKGAWLPLHWLSVSPWHQNISLWLSLPV